MTEQKVRRIVKQRSQGLCEYCGRGGPLEMHHRKNRSQGGQWTVTNIVALCPEDHRWATVNPDKACKEGVSVRSYANEVHAPMLRLGKWVHLETDGTITESEYDNG